MSVEIYGPGESANREWLGEFGNMTWKTAAKLRPALVDAVNSRCVPGEEPWTHQFMRLSDDEYPPRREPFSLDELLEEGVDEVTVLDLSELIDFLDWCDYLVSRNVDAISLLAPLVHSLNHAMHRLRKVTGADERGWAKATADILMFKHGIRASGLSGAANGSMVFRFTDGADKHNFMAVARTSDYSPFKPGELQRSASIQFFAPEPALHVILEGAEFTILMGEEIGTGTISSIEY